MIFLKIAFLNIQKHMKRTILIIGAVALSVIVLVVVSGLSMAVILAQEGSGETGQ